ncbi:hypothetical protein OSB04_016349 [Centaurea solstitialis]|uniref:Uncharacterized protein n=1 Tax=Centaurea solstitialis TaxID=347529 RepID=A0AA38WJL8_9ASTR|nr:hypothetical protein OSB04_016349 [Centaurea solstitialis]
MRAVVNVDEQCVGDGVHEVEFLTPFMQHTSFLANSREEEKEVVGILVFIGSLCSFAYSNSKEPILQALADLKGDIISSLHSRLDIICDEADGQLDSVADVGQEVIIFNSASCQVLRDHCVELISMEAPTNASIILEPEAESTSSITLSTGSFLEIAMAFSSEFRPSSIDNSRGAKTSIAKQQSNNVSIMAALLVLILSVLIGVVIYLYVEDVNGGGSVKCSSFSHFLLFVN